MKVNKKRAFTLIELLVVVLIIGILSAIALPQYQKAVEKARAAEAVVLLNNLRKSIDTFCLANPEFVGGVLGCPGNADNKCNILDIDVTSNLICDQDGGSNCRSKYFSYQADIDCDGPSHEIRLYRHKNGDENEDTQYDVQLDTYTGHKWKFSCEDYDDNYPYAKSVCKSFEKL